MLGASLFVAAAGLFGLASAQTPMTMSSGAMTTSSAAMSSAAPPSAAATPTPVAGPYTVAPGSSAAATAAGIWCRDQRSSCSMLCGNSVDANQCIEADLTYLCQCSSGQTPDLSKYNNTLPWYECNAYRDACVAGNTTNSDNQKLCLGVQCGGKLPSDAQSSSSTTSSSMTTMTSSMAQTSAAPSSTAAAVINAPRDGAHALGAIAAGAFALLAL